MPEVLSGFLNVSELCYMDIVKNKQEFNCNRPTIVRIIKYLTINWVRFTTN